ncbi:hypothetical protein DVP73_01315 [Yersinia enterocolitica]|nr:hypothetical protein [Yersinia enterocolitica]EKN5116701.1 hypothetical protein [Yersinia enterocolitica]EKN5120877.1 hypothetical protein [Yersinia enterocolitica]EKN5142702.1 hypothetical protein [Yersinia enterocolitica]EKN5151704.1 hypothetical protein [Yersinia enterocolitica]
MNAVQIGSRPICCSLAAYRQLQLLWVYSSLNYFLFFSFLFFSSLSVLDVLFCTYQYDRYKIEG